MSVLSRPKQVKACIDFGTTFSGFAFSLIEDPRVRLFEDWPGGAFVGQAQYCKTPTAILYRSDGTVVDYGWEAIRKAFETDDSLGEYTLVEGFKLNLSPGNYKEQKVDLPCGLSTETVIKDFLTAIGKNCLQEIKTATDFGAEDIQWCITVPAIWDDYAKSVMSKAMQQAVHLQDAETSSLLIILEPEAAAVACKNKFRLGKGTVVLDVGGGTIDVTLHETSPNGRLKELKKGTGSAAGGIFVDFEFKRFFVREAVGKDVPVDVASHLMQKFGQSHPKDYWKMMGEWERTKRMFTGTETVYIEVPENFLDVLATEAKWLCDGRLISSELEIHPHSMKSFFKPTLSRISSLLKEIVSGRDDTKIPQVLFVGGMAANKYMQAKVKKMCPGKELIVPPQPGAKVVEGGTIYALNPSMIELRRARRTYGVGTCDSFLAGVHPESKRFWSVDRDEYCCRDVFSIFVHRNQALANDQCVAKSFTPIERDQEACKFKIYASELLKPKYVDDPGSFCIGVVTLYLGEPAGSLDRVIDVEMFFGGSSIQLYANDRKSGKDVSVFLDYDSFGRNEADKNAVFAC